MLDEKKLIPLKEASRISGYSADYIGQLIREGKVPGKQVCLNPAWMTTAEAVLTYKKTSKRKNKGEKISFFNEYIRKIRQKIRIEFDILKLFFTTFKASIPVFIVMIISFLFLVFSLFYYYFDKSFEQNNLKQENQEQEISF